MRDRGPLPVGWRGRSETGLSRRAAALQCWMDVGSSRSRPGDRVGQCRPCLGETLQRRVVGPPRRGLEPAVPRGADRTRAARRAAAVDSPLGLPTSGLDDGLAVSHTACPLPPPRLQGLHGAHEPTASPGRNREDPECSALDCVECAGEEVGDGDMQRMGSSLRAVPRWGA